MTILPAENWRSDKREELSGSKQFVSSSLAVSMDVHFLTFLFSCGCEQRKFKQ